jgi:mRNA interferase RelE/StbE
MEKTSEKPNHYFKRLVGRQDYKLRVGDYQGLVKLFRNKNEVYVISLDHKKKIYKKS